MSTARAQTILVPLDGSALSESALAYAEALAERWHAHLVLVRVIEPDGLAEVDPHTPYGSVQAYLDSLAVVLGEHGMTVETSRPVGMIRDEILQEVRLRRADLVVMASHARSAPGRWLFGSVTDAVLRGCGVPVLVIPHAAAPVLPADGALKVLVPLDGSELAEAVLDDIEAWVAAWPGSQFVLARVVGWPPNGVDEAAELIPEQPERDLEYARTYLDRAAERWPRSESPVRCRTTLGASVPSAIVQLAVEEHVDLIAMASHGRGGLSRLMLGSVTTDVLQRSVVPVLVVRGLPNQTKGRRTDVAAVG